MVRRILGGMAALVSLAVTVACGLPDSGPVVERMRAQAEERGLGDLLRYSDVSAGGLGSAPWVRSETEWDADAGQLREIAALLRENDKLNDEIGKAGFSVNVTMRLDGTEVRLHDAPDENQAELMPRLAGEGINRLEVSHNQGLEVYAAEAGYPRIAAATEGYTSTLAVTGEGRTVLTGPFRPDAVLEVLTQADEARRALAPQGIGPVRATDRINELSVFVTDFRAETFAPLVGVVPDGTRLVIQHGTEAKLNAVIGGTSPKKTRNKNEAALRAVVEKQ